MFNFKSAIALSIAITVIATSCGNNAQPEQDAASIPQPDTAVFSPLTPNPDSLLLPGDAAVKIKIDQNSDDVFKVLGRADSSDAAMQKMVAFWFYNQNGNKYSTAIYAARDTANPPVSRVRQIRITSPSFKTEQGLGVTSTLADIKKVYKVHEIIYPLAPKQELHVWSDGKGMAFEVDDDQRCTAVIIYKKGDEPGSTYLPLR